MTEDVSRERRRVLRAGIGVVVAAGCLAGMSVRTLRSAAAATGKPPLTAANINRLLADGDAAKTLRAASRGLKMFLNDNFFLTPAQTRAVDSVTPEEIQKVEQALARKAAEVATSLKKAQLLQKEASRGEFFGKFSQIAREGDPSIRLGLSVEEIAGQMKIVAKEVAL